MVAILILNTVAFLFMLGVNFSSGIFMAFLKAFGATEVIISLSSTALYLTRGTSSMLIDRLSQKISFKKLFIIAFLGSAISTFLFTIPNNPIILATLRAIQGIFSGLYWVLINIYAISLGSRFMNKFKNLSSVTIFLNLGGFLGSVISGKIASAYSPYLSFYIGIAFLVIGAVVCLFLKDIKQDNQESVASSKNNLLNDKERIILIFAVFTSCIFVYINIGIPLFILELGGSYKEIGTTSGLGIMTAALVIGIAPYLKKKYSYKTIMTVDYMLIIICLFAIFHFKSILLIYILQSILVGIVTLERNIWYAIIQEISKNYNRSVGLLRGYMDYIGAVFFLVYGYIIQTLGSMVVVIIISILVALALIVLNFAKQMRFLRHYKTIHIKSVCQYKHILHRIST